MFFAIVLLGGLLQALFGLLRLGTLIKFAPQPVMAGFQNMAAVLLFLVQLGNVLGFDRNVAFTRVFGAMGEAKPLSALVAVLTFLVMWHARRITTKVPPLLVGLGCGIVLYYALVAMGLGTSLGPVIGQLTASAAMRTVLVDFSGLAMAQSLEHSVSVILSGALALAIIASIDALLCAKLTSQPGELRAGDDRLLIRLGIANAVSAGFGGITNGINIGPSLVNRAFGGRSLVSVLVNAGAVLLAATVLFPLLAYIPRAVLSATIMVIAIQHIEPWTKQLAARLIAPGTPQRGAIALDLGVSLFVSALSITINIVLAVFIGIALAVLLFVVRMSRSNIRRLYRCDTVRSRRYRDPAELEVLHRAGGSVLVIELQGALFFGSAERLAQIVDREAAAGTTALLAGMRRITEIDSTGARILGELDAALKIRGVRLALILSGRTETAARLADIFQGDRFFPDIDRAIEWAEDELLAERRDRAVRGVAARPPAAADDLDARTDRAVARLAGAGGVVRRRGDFPQRRSRLGALSGHQGARQRPHQARRWRYKARDLCRGCGVRRTRTARPRPALGHHHRGRGFAGLWAERGVIRRAVPRAAGYRDQAVDGAGARTERAHPLRQSDDPAIGDVRHHGGSTAIKTPAAHCRPPPS